MHHLLLLLPALLAPCCGVLLCVQVRTNKRYAGAGQFTVSEVAERVKADVGNIDIVVGCSSWSTLLQVNITGKHVTDLLVLHHFSCLHACHPAPSLYQFRPAHLTVQEEHRTQNKQHC
jgi:hypothetical protein